MQGAATLSVEPNPALEGQDITISYDGPGQVSVSVDFGQEQPVPIDPGLAAGKFRVPPGSRVLNVLVDGDPPSAVLIEVASASKRPSP